MKTFNVRLEFDINAIGLLDVPVTAKTAIEAKKIAIKKFYDDALNLDDIRLVEDFEDIYFRQNSTKDFIVEEVSDE